MGGLMIPEKPAQLDRVLKARSKPEPFGNDAADDEPRHIVYLEYQMSLQLDLTTCLKK